MHTSWSRTHVHSALLRKSAAVAVFFVGIAAPIAQGQTIIPSAGQTPEQMAADRTACDNQAASQSGYHPSQTAPSASRDQPVAGQRVAGAARGAAAGAVREERTDSQEREYEDAVGAGAKAGAVAGGVRQRQERRESRRETAQGQSAYEQKRDGYYQAFSACMMARGYSLQ